MPDPDFGPLPASLSIDHVLRVLTEYAGFRFIDGDVDTFCAYKPSLVMAWVSAAAWYTTADYQIQMLHRQIIGMREEIALSNRLDSDEIEFFVDQLRGLLTEHVKLSTERGDAHTAFINACGQMRVEGALESGDGQWHDIALIARGWSEPTTVRVPHDASAPWPLVRVGLALMERLTWRRPALTPQPGFPVVRRLLAGFVSLDHDGVKQRLLPDSDGWYWLRGFAWSTPASEQSAGQPDPHPAAPKPCS